VVTVLPCRPLALVDTWRRSLAGRPLLRNAMLAARCWRPGLLAVLPQLRPPRALRLRAWPVLHRASCPIRVIPAVLPPPGAARQPTAPQAP
jgi:hypothetical protein